MKVTAPSLALFLLITGAVSVAADQPKEKPNRIPGFTTAFDRGDPAGLDRKGDRFGELLHQRVDYVTAIEDHPSVNSTLGSQGG